MPFNLPLLPTSALLGAAMIGGTFLAFSNFVMPALKRLPPPDAIRAMQTINRTVINPWFLGCLLGTAALAAAALAADLQHWPAPAARASAAACALYSLTILVTLGGNVPLNNRLASIDPASASASAAWADFYARWLRWNHLRGATALLAALALAACLAAGLR